MGTVTITGISATAALGPGAVAGTGGIKSAACKGDLVPDDAKGAALALKVFGALFPDFSRKCVIPEGRTCEFDDGDTIEMTCGTIGIFDITKITWNLDGCHGSETVFGFALGAGVNSVTWTVKNVR